ncbi:MAG: glycerophosphodiester phosphodiesterase, partial [Chryseobacterium sp.]
NTIEMDTKVTADGEVILSHDDYMNPLMTTKPDGTFLTPEEKEKFPFMQMPYSEIKKFDVGMKYFPVYPRQRKMKVGIPLLKDLIDSVQQYIKQTGKKQVFYNIETKSSRAGDNTLNPVPEVFVKKLMDVLISKKITPYVIIQSGDERTLQVLHEKYPYIRTSYLLGYNSRKQTLDDNLKVLGFLPFIYSPNYKLVDAKLVKACHEKGMKIIPWTPDTQEEINQLRALGVDGIITNYPELLVK